MRRTLSILALVPFSLFPLLLGAKGCSDKDCRKLKDAAVVACAAQSDSMLCAEARRQAEACGAPERCPPAPDGLQCENLDPTKDCGACWRCNARTGYAWVQATKTCPEATCPEATRPGDPACSAFPAGAKDCWTCKDAAWYWRDCTDTGCPAGQECVIGHADIASCVAPPPPGPPASCVPDTTGWVHRPGPVVNLGKVGIAEDAVRAAHPELFIEDGRRLAKGPAGIDEFFAFVGEALRNAGTCAAQAHEGGELKDNLAVAVGDGSFEGWQLVEYGAARLRDLVNACKAGEGGCTWAPPAEQPPPAAECPPPLPDRTEGKLIITCTTGAWIDCTVKTIMTCDYCAAIGMGEFNGAIRCGCPMRKEDDPNRLACELYAMAKAIVWETQPAGCPVELRNGNPWVARCDGCERMRVCSGDSALCSGWTAAP